MKRFNKIKGVVAYDIAIYLKSVQLNLLLDEIDVGFLVYSFSNSGTSMHSNIVNKKLQSDPRFSALWPAEKAISRIQFTKTSKNKYQITQIFSLGSKYIDEQFLEHYFEVSGGSSWELEKFKHENVTIGKADSMDLSRDLTSKLSQIGPVEVDTRTLNVGDPYDSTHPLITHFFGTSGNDVNIYTGSEIALEQEVVKNLRSNKIPENLIKFHDFARELN